MDDDLGQGLVGEELSGVGFVRDYVELYFDGPVFRLLGEITFQSSEPRASSDLESQLRALIGSMVTGIRNSKNSIEIEFSGGFSVIVRADPRLPEYAHLITYPDNRMVVWQTE